MSQYKVIINSDFVTVEPIEVAPISITRIGYNRYKVVLTASGRVFVIGNISEQGQGVADILATLQAQGALIESGIGQSDIFAAFSVAGQLSEVGTGQVRIFSGEELQGVLSEIGLGASNITAAFELAQNLAEQGQGVADVTALFRVVGSVTEQGQGVANIAARAEVAGVLNESGAGEVDVEEEVPPSLDPDYEAVLNAVAAGDRPGATTQADQNAFMIALKAALSANGGTLANLDELLVFDGDGASTFKARNWANPSQTVTFQSGLTLNSGGAFGDGTATGIVSISRGWFDLDGLFNSGNKAFYIHALRKLNDIGTPIFQGANNFTLRNQISASGTPLAISANSIYASARIFSNIEVVDRRSYAAWTPKDGSIVRARYGTTEASREPSLNINGGDITQLYVNTTNGGVVFIKGGNLSWDAVKAIQDVVEAYVNR